MNELTSLGLILLFALLVGHLVKIARVPEVTGYLVAGMLVGPSVLGWVSHENLEALHVFSEVGLGLILFSIGGVFEIGRMRRVGRRVLLLALTESMCAAALVAVGLLAIGQSWPAAFMLAAIAVETGAASTLMVVRENNADGEFTESLIGVIGLNNILALVGFSLVAAAIELTAMRAATGLDALTVVRALFPLLWQLVGSSALGFLVGLMLASWASQVVETGETLILLVGCILLTVGVSSALDLSSLVASLAVGATLANLSVQSRRLFVALSHTDPPLYVIFFVLAGADLNLALLPSLGLVGAVYVLGRASGKLGGAWIGARRVESPLTVQRYLGLSILAQAGLAVGLVLVTRQRFPELAPLVSTVVLGAVAVFEVAGPLSARFALDRSGESRPQPERPTVLDL
ncbi:MAG TPA: cation:proton antiporter [Gemmatimonadaceae bacterium]|nr:cation:proton antiporter [Gemmatimonadaceae bacterium]